MKTHNLRFASLTSILLLLAYGSGSFAEQADNHSPVGVWRAIEAKTGKTNSHIKIWESDGKMYGKIIKLFVPDGETPFCEKCEGKLHNKPVLGMVILKGLSKDGDKWSGGTIFDPRKGETYDVYVEVLQGGNKLKVHGYIGVALLGRSEYWYRLQ